MSSFDKKSILGWMQPINPKYDDYNFEIFSNIEPDIESALETDLFSNENPYENNKKQYLSLIIYMYQ